MFISTYEHKMEVHIDDGSWPDLTEVNKDKGYAGSRQGWAGRAGAPLSGLLLPVK
jgi:hypothetical protein